jgi:hypothetical protein
MIKSKSDEEVDRIRCQVRSGVRGDFFNVAPREVNTIVKIIQTKAVTAPLGSR